MQRMEICKKRFILDFFLFAVFVRCSCGHSSLVSNSSKTSISPNVMHSENGSVSEEAVTERQTGHLSTDIQGKNTTRFVKLSDYTSSILPVVTEQIDTTATYRVSSTLPNVVARRNTKDTNTVPTLEMVPKGRWSGRPSQIPSFLNCTYTAAEHFSCPEWDIKGSHHVRLERVFSRFSRGLVCQSFRRLAIRSEAFRNLEILVEVTCNLHELRSTLQLRILPYQPVECKNDYDCATNYSTRSECKLKGHEKICVCHKDFYFNGIRCLARTNSRSPGVYKATLVAVVCFAVIVIALFVIFVCNRTIFRRRGSQSPLHDQIPTSQESDIYLVSDNLARLRMKDKPPSYQDVMKNDRLHRGVPPPAYTSSYEELVTQPGTSRSSVCVRTETADEHFRITRLAFRLNQLRKEVRSSASTTPQNQHRNQTTETHDNFGYVLET